MAKGPTVGAWLAARTPDIRGAVERLRELILEAAHVPKTRRPTQPTRGSQRRRVEGKVIRGQVKALRGKVSGRGGE